MNSSQPLDTRPIVTLVGRPNVGKSTLFNALTRRRGAIVFDQPGVTRDRKYTDVSLPGGRSFRLADTAGTMDGRSASSGIEKAVLRQWQQAISEADLIVFVVDAREGYVPGDEELVGLLRSQEKPILAVVNKVDPSAPEAEFLAPFYKMGLPHLLPISAEHKLGLEELRDAIAKYLPTTHASSEPTEDSPLLHATRLAIVGRPNVGKSSLLNRLVGEERAVVSEIPGTTRDSIDAYVREGEDIFQFMDTAGIRRRGKTEGVEGLSAIKSLQTLEEAHVAVLVLDLSEGVTDQDYRIAGQIHKAGRGALIFANKVDLLPRAKRRISEATWQKEIHGAMPLLEYAPVLLGSAMEGKFPRKRFFDLVRRIERARHLELQTKELNEYIAEVLQQRSLPVRHGRRLKVYYMTQAVAHNEKRGLRPSTPRFVCFVNDPGAVREEDKRFLINSLRRRYRFFGNPIDLQIRARSPQEGEES